MSLGAAEGGASAGDDRLALFCVFHANLDFSALPADDVARVLDRCYAPLLRACEELSFPIGIEMPGRTLLRIAREEPELLKTMRSLAERGLVELVGSGRAQIVGPLAPVDVNRANLADGARIYEEVFGRRPTTWFVNEQTFSPGLPELYREVGAQALVMEWNNPASYRRELRPLRHASARVAAGPHAPLPLLWNDSIVFQRLQRAVQGELPLAEYLGFLDEQVPRAGGRLCAYGGDLEIFDYRPGRAAPPGAENGLEMARLARIFGALASRQRFRLLLPRDAAQGDGIGPVVELASASDPIPCKKQPRYNPTRWAVSGRAGLEMNTACFALRRAARALEAAGALEAGEADGRLADLWRSDLRTRATEEKSAEFRDHMGAATLGLRARFEAAVPPLEHGECALLWNPWDSVWPREPAEVALQLPPGAFQAARARVVRRDDRVDPDSAQLDVIDRHRDGSLRRVRIVAAPELAAGETVGLRIEPSGDGPAACALVARGPEMLRSEHVAAEFLPHRGGALRSLEFRGFGEQPLLGTIAHGSFDSIAYSPDFYSGQVILFTADGRKLTSLAPAEVELGSEGSPLRVEIAFRVTTPAGTWVTRYRVYRDRPRLDLCHELELREVDARSLRLGISTWLPGAFDRSGFRLRSVNGGAQVEEHVFERGACLDQARAVSPQVTAAGCLGATEGWVAVGDQSHGVGVIADRSVAAVAPMIEFADVDDGFLMRLFHSAVESDETRSGFHRGVLRFPFAIVPHATDVAGVRQAAKAIERGLFVRTARGVELTGGL